MWRSPAVGIIPANSAITVRLQVPMDVNTESPLVLTLNAKAILHLREVQANLVMIDNQSNKAVPYLMVIVPRHALALKDMGWRQRLEMIARRIFPNLPQF
jgi:hypothetical protein